MNRYLTLAAINGGFAILAPYIALLLVAAGKSPAPAVAAALIAMVCFSIDIAAAIRGGKL